VLVLSPGKGASGLARALAGAGYEVITATQASELPDPLEPATHDAVVLDLSAKEVSGRRGAVFAEALGRLQETSERLRPAVVVVTATGAPLEGVPLPADAWAPARDAGQVLREVRAAIALKSLERASAENDGLKAAVGFARHTAHELAQPLTTILARAQLLLGSLEPDDPHYRAISVICREAERLAATAEQFNKLKEMIAPPRGT
jgi:signal transduction histidine kinase